MTIRERDLAQEVTDLKARVERLEAIVTATSGDGPQVQPLAPEEPLNHAQIVAWLKAQGLVREPTAEERRLAAEWDALPEEEKAAILWELDHLPPGPLASDIIIEGRR